MIIVKDENPDQLVHEYVEFQRSRRKEQLADAEHALEKMEQHSEWGKQWQTLELELPSNQVPKFKRPVSYMTDGKLRGAVVRGAGKKSIVGWMCLILKLDESHSRSAFLPR